MCKCDVCKQSSNDLTYLDLFVWGSEGVNICLNCRITLGNIVRELTGMFYRIKLEKRHGGVK